MKDTVWYFIICLEKSYKATVCQVPEVTVKKKLLYNVSIVQTILLYKHYTLYSRYTVIKITAYKR